MICYSSLKQLLVPHENLCLVWHSSLTNEKSDQIESIQKRALKILWGFSIIDYEQMRYK